MSEPRGPSAPCHQHVWHKCWWLMKQLLGTQFTKYPEFRPLKYTNRWFEFSAVIQWFLSCAATPCAKPKWPCQTGGHMTSVVAGGGLVPIPADDWLFHHMSMYINIPDSKQLLGPTLAEWWCWWHWQSRMAQRWAVLFCQLRLTNFHVSWW